MRVVFMGTPRFAAEILDELAEFHEIAAVYTRPDAVRGRGKALVPSPVKEVAERRGFPVRTPRTLRDAEVLSELAAFAPDVICVAAYGAILPKEVLDLPPFGCLNVHGSLLPRWRGAAPIERAILAGDEEIGVCIMAMEEGLDTGDFCVCRSLPAGSRTAAELTEELAALGATALAQAEAGNLRWVAQDEAQVTYAEKIAKGELNLDPAESAVANDRRVRASGAAHPARAVVAGRPLTVLGAHVADDAPADRLGSGAAALIANRLLLGCAEGVLEVTEVKPDGKRAMDARSFAAGVPALRGEEGIWSRA